MHGIVVGRFQPVHNGHVALIEHALSECARVTVVIGSSTEPESLRNPFSAQERQEMIHAAFGDRIDVVAVPDLHDPPRYAAHVLAHTGPADRAYGNDSWTLDLFEAYGLDVSRPGLVARDQLEGTALRAGIAEGDRAWRKAVPAGVAEVLDRIEASKRLARIS